MESTDIQTPPSSDRTAPLKTTNGLQLYPVSIGDSGEGLPYAPVNWPNPGDKWRWKAGRRLRSDGYYQDRYLYPPTNLVRGGPRKTYPLASKTSIEHYVRSICPGADMNAFFDSFSWKIPSQQLSNDIGHQDGPVSSDKAAENSDFRDLASVGCKAGNRTCSSLVESGNTPVEFMACTICCSEPGFCLYCCCIICCKIASSDYDGYCYIRCEAKVDGGYICGHIAHIECALRCYMAGTVGGSIGLDAEYYCRRCDSRTDLLHHVMKLVATCQTIDSQDSIEKILSVGICLLRNSQKACAQQLLLNIQAAIVKLKRGTKLNDIWSHLNSLSVAAAGSSSENGVSPMILESEHEDINTRPEAQMPFGLKLDLRIESPKLEDEVDQVLLNLRKSQQCEYNLAEGRLLAQKDLIQSLYEQLEKDGCDLSTNASHVDSSAWLDAVMERVERVKGEIKKFNEMKEVAKGFGRTSKQVLENHFGVEPE